MIDAYDLTDSQLADLRREAEAAARTWKNVYFVRADRRLVEVTGLQNEDTIEAALSHARHSARADEHEIEVLYTDDTRDRFAVRTEDRPRAD